MEKLETGAASQKASPILGVELFVRFLDRDLRNSAVCQPCVSSNGSFDRVCVLGRCVCGGCGMKVRYGLIAAFSEAEWTDFARFFSVHSSLGLTFLAFFYLFILNRRPLPPIRSLVQVTTAQPRTIALSQNACARYFLAGLHASVATSIATHPLLQWVPPDTGMFPPVAALVSGGCQGNCEPTA